MGNARRGGREKLALFGFLSKNCRKLAEKMRNQRHKARGWGASPADLSRKPRHLPVIMKHFPAQTGAVYTIPHTILLRGCGKVKKN
jgi:hypothetical protein